MLSGGSFFILASGIMRSLVIYSTQVFDEWLYLITRDQALAHYSDPIIPLTDGARASVRGNCDKISVCESGGIGRRARFRI